MTPNTPTKFSLTPDFQIGQRVWHPRGAAQFVLLFQRKFNLWRKLKPGVAAI